MITPEQIITEVIKREGGGTYTNSPSDPNPTRWGITQATLSAYWGRQATEDDVKALSEGTAREIYRKRFIFDPGYDKIQDYALQAFVIDTAVNFGPGGPGPTWGATEMLQEVLGFSPQDGILGPKTLAAIDTVGAKNVLKWMIVRRMQSYVRSVKKQQKMAEFMAKNPDLLLVNLEGWLNRDLSFL